MDIWAAGCVLYEMIYNRVPYPNGLNRQPNGHNLLVFPSTLKNPTAVSNSHPSKELQCLVKGMLTFDPTKRTAAEQVLNHPWLTAAPAPVALSDAARMFPDAPQEEEGGIHHVFPMDQSPAQVAKAVQNDVFVPFPSDVLDVQEHVFDPKEKQQLSTFLHLFHQNKPTPRKPVTKRPGKVTKAQRQHTQANRFKRQQLTTQLHQQQQQQQPKSSAKTEELTFQSIPNVIPDFVFERPIPRKVSCCSDEFISVPPIPRKASSDETFQNEKPFEDEVLDAINNL